MADLHTGLLHLCDTRTAWFGSETLIYKELLPSYVYWTVHHLDSWIKIDQLDVTCFIISLFTAQHVSNVSTSIFFRSLRLIVDLFHVLYCSASIKPEQYNPWNKSTIRRKLLKKMDVLTFETCWAVNSEIIKQVTSSWSIFIQLLPYSPFLAEVVFHFLRWVAVVYE